MGDNGVRRKRENEEVTYTVSEILEANSHWEETATAVLGGSDNENCSYDKGYVKRQALYACLTCNPANTPSYVAAGICLACSMKCHESHELVELYTKRNFRCDCGNKKFPNTPCLLQPVKNDNNTDNKYNHNFKGLYCMCDRPYPDSEEEDDDDDDEMIQCVVCEDWFHGQHTENDFVDLASDLIDDSEFICATCTKRCDFLVHYGNNMLRTESVKDDETICVPNDDAVNTEGAIAQDGEQLQNYANANKSSELDSTASGVTASNLHSRIEESCDREEASQDSGIASNSEASNQDILGSGTVDNAGQCLLESNAADTTLIGGGTWWTRDWRSKLCKCKRCVEKYEGIGVSFLIDPEDPLDVYEAIGRENDKNKVDLGQQMITQVLSGLNHVQQIEVIHGYNEMKEGLTQLLDRIASAGGVVTPEDIHTMFAEMRANKRRRLDEHTPPDNCR